MVLRLAPLLLVLGCAGSQSAFPLPPAFSPVEDAPITVGHPGYVTPEPERSPHKRVLPETPMTRREPGIWAGDEPKASRLPDLLDVVFPFPDGVEPESVPALRQCAESYGAAFAALDEAARRADLLAQHERACLVYAMLGNCLYESEKRAHGSVPQAVLRLIDGLFQRCYPHFNSYKDIINDIERIRGKAPSPRPRTVH